MENEVIELVQGLLGAFVVFVSDEGESSGLVGIGVPENFDPLNVSTFGELFLEVVFLEFRKQSPHIERGVLLFSSSAGMV